MASEPGIDPALAIAGATALVLLVGGPLLVFALAPKEKSVSAAQALDTLADEANGVLVDLRPKVAVKEEGTPDLRSVGGRRKYVKMPAIMDEEIDIERYANLVDTKDVVIFLDSYGGYAKEVARLLAKEKVDNVAYVTDGTEGPFGWKATEMPWKKPFALSLPDFSEVVENYKEDPSPTNTALAVAGGVGLLSFLFIEYEGAMEALSLFLGLSFLASKTLLAKDRETTNRQIKAWLDNKEPPADLVQEVEDFKGKALGEAEVEAEPMAVVEELPVAAEEPAPEPVPEPVAEPVAEPEPEPAPAPVKMETKRPKRATQYSGSSGGRGRSKMEANSGNTDILDIMKKVVGEDSPVMQEVAETAAEAEAEPEPQQESAGEGELDNEDKAEVSKWIDAWKEKTNELQQ